MKSAGAMWLPAGGGGGAGDEAPPPPEKLMGFHVFQSLNFNFYCMEISENHFLTKKNLTNLSYAIHWT